MRSVKEIDADIAMVKAELQDVHGSVTEVYARIVGYYRSVRNWNPGKREEYRERKIFIADEKRIEEHLPVLCSSSDFSGDPSETQTAGIASDSTDSESISRYELFMRKSCPNCPPVKECCAKLDMAGEHIDVDSADGFARASAFGVFSAPTVIFFDAAGTEVCRAHSTNEIKSAINAVYAGESILSAAV
jgi:hypothetical protein